MSGLLKSGVVVVAIVSLTACIATSQRFPSSTPIELLKVETPKNCRAAGGTWSRTAFGFRTCLVEFSDARKQCRYGKECLGHCIWEDPADWAACKGPQCAEYPADGSYGLCQKSNYEPGCHGIVQAGRQMEMICED